MFAEEPIAVTVLLVFLLTSVQGALKSAAGRESKHGDPYKKTGLLSPVFCMKTSVLDVKQEVHYVAVFTDISFAFDTQFTGIFGASFAVTGNKVIK